MSHAAREEPEESLYAGRDSRAMATFCGGMPQAAVEERFQPSAEAMLAMPAWPCAGEIAPKWGAYLAQEDAGGRVGCKRGRGTGDVAGMGANRECHDPLPSTRFVALMRDAPGKPTGAAGHGNGLDRAAASAGRGVCEEI